MKQTLLKRAAIVACTTLCAAAAQAQDPPTMGWSSWNTFALNINEQTIMSQASVMRQRFLKAGYDHINIDDGYFGGRDPETGKLLIHPQRFPNGLKPVVDFIHKLGLKAGIYSDGGYDTCGSYHGGDKSGVGVGLYKHDQQDCDLFFKELGFDFIKVDFCGGVDYHNKDKINLDAETRYKEIAQAIKNTGRDDVRMNVCRWDYPGNWVQDVAVSWRTTGDIYASWTSVKDILAQNLYLSAYCYDGHYNDMDMLEVGRGLSKEEDRTHFGMWCIMSSPLLIGCDMLKVSGSTLLLLTNPDLVALNQDKLCLQAYVVQHEGGTYVLTKDIETLYGNTRAVAFYNPSDKKAEMSIPLADLDLDGTATVRDLYEQKDLEPVSQNLTATVPAHGTRIYLLRAERRLERALYEAESAYLGKYQEIFNNRDYKSAIYEGNEACSGRAMVSWLGGDAKNDLQWRNVYSEQGGDYELTLTYASAETRSLTLNVNGKDIQKISCNSGAWDRTGTKTCTVTLLPGENVVRLYNKNDDWMPNIDCMQVKPVGATDRIPVGVDAPRPQAQPLDPNARYYALDGRPVKQPRKGGIYIRDGRKVFVK